MLRRRREIPVELTSLLDVILIMLFVLLLQARTQTEQAQSYAAESTERQAAIEQRLEQAEAERAEAVRERDALSRRILTDQIVLENSVILTLSVGEDRSILAEVENGGNRSIGYAWEEDGEAAEQLRSFCRDFLRTAAGKSVFLVFLYDRNRIYHAEYEMIASVVRQIREEAVQAGIAFSTVEADLSAAAQP